MFVRENFADIYLRGMRDRSMRSRTELAREIQLTDWSTAGNLSNRSSGVQIPRGICTRFGRYLYSTKCSWIIITVTLKYVFLYHATEIEPITKQEIRCIFDGFTPRLLTMHRGYVTWIVLVTVSPMEWCKKVIPRFLVVYHEISTCHLYFLDVYTLALGN